MSIPMRSFLVLTTLTFLAMAVPVTAQIPDEFTNLTVLPKDISKRELVNIMRAFSGALGQRCSYCHVGEDPTDLATFDFASDDKEEKNVARLMMKMVGEINNTELAELKRDNVTQVRCVTCHRGVTKPETIDNIVLQMTEKDGIDAAVAKYRDLREEYYGEGSYDFGSGPLNMVAERLAGEHNNVEGAISIMKMNIELHPDEAYPYLLLGRIYQASGNTAAAIENLEKSLELEPDNAWAKGLLQKLKASE